MKCIAKNQNDNICPRYVKGENTKYCDAHRYFDSYTEEMMGNLHVCSGCKKYRYYDPNSTYSGVVTVKCTECIGESVKCASEKCKFKRSVENKYCVKHQRCIFVDETKAMGKKLCHQYVRGCDAQLDADYPYSRCRACLDVEKEKDHARRGGAKNMDVSLPDNKICSVCCQEFPKTDFVGDKMAETKTCVRCREMSKRNNEHRDKENRNKLAREASKKPENIETKEKWKEENYEKIAGYWMKSRQKSIETMGADNYMAKLAEDAKKWREKNPEKCAENNKNRNNNIKIHFTNYVRTSNYKNLAFELTETEFEEIVKNECHYCGLFTKGKTFNGIDRKDQTKGYIVGNCVSCCEMCNFIKKSLSDEIFLERVEHILTYNKCIKGGKYYPSAFANHICVDYNQYKKRASSKQLEFELDENTFYEIASNNCYICGKSPSKTHNNGIDRFDSKIGYTLDNCRPCCGECNYMKNNYNYNNFMEKLKLIYQRLNTKMPAKLPDDTVLLLNEFTVPKYIKRPKIIIGENENIEHPLDEAQQTDSSKPSIVNEQKEKRANNIMVVSNKKSKEEIKMYATEKKRQQRENLKQRYGDEEYKKMRAKEIAEWRKKNKPEKPVLTEEEKAENTRERKKKDMQKYRELAKNNVENNIQPPQEKNTNNLTPTPKIVENITMTFVEIEPFQPSVNEPIDEKTNEPKTNIKENNVLKFAETVELEHPNNEVANKNVKTMKTKQKCEKTPEMIREINRLNKIEQRKRDKLNENTPKGKTTEMMREEYKLAKRKQRNNKKEKENMPKNPEINDENNK
jgi:hypothetical protein